MLRSANDLIDFSIAATDGDIGRVEEFYFDEEQWTIRYIVVNTGGWFNQRKLLISPLSVERTDLMLRHIETPLTREEVKASPRLEAAREMSRSHEAAYNKYYRFPDYWRGAKLWGAAESPKEIDLHRSRARNPDPGAPDSFTRHLRGTGQVAGYAIAARDGTIGHVDDLIIDDETWTIRYFAIDTRNWWPGKKVLLSPRWITRVGWQEKQVFVDLPREEIKSSPEYNDAAPIEREYEERLHEYYGEDRYWHSGQNKKKGGKQYGTGSR
jgi:uncharacterized protein YrrD